MKASHLFVLLFLLHSCQLDTTKKDLSDAEIKKAVNQILDEWHEAAASADYEKYMSVLDSNSIFIGTDITENWTKEEFAQFSKPIFDKGKAWDFGPLDRNIYLNEWKDLVWFDEILNTWMEVCIGSGILQNKGDEWKIKHYVLSVAVPNEDIGAVISAKRQNDSLLLQDYSVNPK